MLSIASASSMSFAPMMRAPAPKMQIQAKDLPGVTGPFGFFDPLGFAKDLSTPELMLRREAELAHGRVAMIGALGFLVQEAFHPLFPQIDGPAINQLSQVSLSHSPVSFSSLECFPCRTPPSYTHAYSSPSALFFTLTPFLHPHLCSSLFLTRYPAMSLLASQLTVSSNGKLAFAVMSMMIGFAEIARARFGWIDPNDLVEGGGRLQEGYTPGDLGFDPLGMKPKGAAELLQMQNKEINNGRLAMLAVAGMVGQELTTQQALF